MKKSLIILSVFAVGLTYGQKSTKKPTFSVEREKVKSSVMPSGEREFKTKSEKQDFIEQNVRTEERTIISSDPSFPKYINTGNKKADASNYARNKAEWIEKNPEKYEKMNSYSKKNAESIRNREQKNNIKQKH
ncbi:MAG: hypothetical protein CL857_05555 [Cryomorphaceae bacterium]|nr:hypothetical protein [Cryomorphaceae bacterium]|tara:strand:+ start:441 stop:839 length:399 start_codon:yes stop_codon:yes gene_type:complete